MLSTVMPCFNDDHVVVIRYEHWRPVSLACWHPVWRLQSTRQTGRRIRVMVSSSTQMRAGTMVPGEKNHGLPVCVLYRSWAE